MAEQDYRSWGETKNCHGCRFWSEMIAFFEGGGGIQAMCLGDGPMRGKYTFRRQHCEAWKSGHYGAVDDPYEDTTALYESDEEA